MVGFYDLLKYFCSAILTISLTNTFTSMRLDRIIQALLPHDEMFFVYFDKLARQIVDSADLLRTLTTTSGPKRIELEKKIKTLEQQGDSITHEIYAELNRTFVTPFDREDIHLLASRLDDIIDFIDGSAKRYNLYKIRDNNTPIQQLAEIIYQSSLEVQQGVSLINDFRRQDDFKEIFNKINQFENDADTIFDNAIAELFENEKNPIEVIKTKEVLVSLETATDRCEDVSNVLETLLIKHA
ncbi:MAG: DUF47 domain-containing protein [Bacteroidetes bacterium]|nr:DUF47 domain-containing protein [Bacteroidota bacterium]